MVHELRLALWRSPRQEETMRDKLNSSVGAVFGGLWAGIALAFTVGDVAWLYILWRTGQPIQDARLQTLLLAVFGSLHVGLRLGALSTKRQRLVVSLKPGARIHLAGLLARPSNAPEASEQGVFSLSGSLVVALELVLDLVHHGEEGDIVQVSAKLDTDWPLLREFGHKELQGELGHYTNPGGGSVGYVDRIEAWAALSGKTGDDLHVAGERRLKTVRVYFNLQPSLSGRSDGFKALSGLTRLALDVQVVAGRERHKLRVEFDTRQMGREVREEVGRASEAMLNKCKESGRVPEPSEIGRYLDCLVDVYELPPRKRARRWPWSR